MHGGGKINNSCWLSFRLSHGDGRRGWDEYGMGIVRRNPEREREREGGRLAETKSVEGAEIWKSQKLKS